MKTIKHLSDQLKAYSITAITVAASSSTINATVINNNLNANIQDSSFDLDLNNDGVNDFTIQASLISSDWSKTSDPSSAGGPGGQSNWTWKWVGGSANMSLNATATPDGYNALMTTGGFSTVSAVPQGGTIGPEKNFVSEALNIGGLWWGEWQERKYDMVNNSTLGSVIVGFTTWSGSSWRVAGEEKKYVGLKFKIGDDFHYGWLRVRLSGAGTNTHQIKAKILSYGYEDVPETMLHAGSLVGIEDFETKESNVYSFGNKVYVNNVKKGSSINI